MSIVDSLQAHSFARRAPPHRIIIARGDDVRTFTVRPWLVATLALVGTVFALVYLAATGYLVFRDDLLATSFARRSHIQNVYEDRIAALRADVDRLTSRQLLRQEDIEAQVKKLVGRQSALDARQDILAGLNQTMRQAGVTPPTVSGRPAAVQSDARGQPPANDGVHTSSLEPADGAGSGGAASPMAKVRAVASSLDQLAEKQVDYVDAVAEKVTRNANTVAKVLKSIGQDVPAGDNADSDAVGGPYVSIDDNADPATFRATVALVAGEIDRYAAMRRFARQLPLSRPLPDAVVTSRFGTRIDPFLGTPAMHTGVDFRAVAGTPVPATAAGTVTSAGPAGGYGNMVEIDHGNGIATRYAHLSEIRVRVGQVVGKGTIVGLSGSTGRSTGPHLHYEVRVDGSAIDPMTYIAAGDKILPLL